MCYLSGCVDVNYDIYILNYSTFNIFTHYEFKHYSFRWEIEIFFKELKQYLGLGDYQVRPYRAIVRHIRFACMAYLFLIHFQLRRNIKSQGIKKPLLHFRNRTTIENFQFIQRKLNSKKGVTYLKDFYEALSKNMQLKALCHQCFSTFSYDLSNL